MTGVSGKSETIGDLLDERLYFRDRTRCIRLFGVQSPRAPGQRMIDQLLAVRESRRARSAASRFDSCSRFAIE
jgi:hypothetical protein